MRSIALDRQCSTTGKSILDSRLLAPSARGAFDLLRNVDIGRMIRLVAGAVLLAATLHLIAVPQAMGSDYEVGWRAYNRGDHSAAYETWKPLADFGDPQAQLMVGLLYANGEGVERDVAEAYMWFLISAANGNEHAKSLYEGASNLDKLLSPEEKADAERRAEQWQPSEAN